MIQLIDHVSADAHRDLLDGMFADRHRLFVQLYGWNLATVDGRLEVDRFDTRHTIYLVAQNDDGSHDASLRLMPSTQPHMLAEVFSFLCPGGVPVGQTVWESTRLCLPQRHGATGRRHLRDQLISAMVDFALQRGIERITGVLPESFRREVLSMGWVAEALGPPTRLEDGTVGAFAAHIAPDTPSRLSWTGTYVPSKLAVES